MFSLGLSQLVWYSIPSPNCKFNYQIKDFLMQYIIFQELDFDDPYGFLPTQDILRFYGFLLACYN